MAYNQRSHGTLIMTLYVIMAWLTACLFALYADTIGIDDAGFIKSVILCTFLAIIWPFSLPLLCIFLSTRNVK